METDGDAGRRRQSLSDRRTDSTNLRELLKEDSRNSSGVTLASVLSSNKRTTAYPANRTLFDIIREDSTGSKDNKKIWKNFKDKLRLRRAGSAWTSSVPIPASDIPTRRQSTRLFNAPDSDDPAPESTHPVSSSSVSVPGETRPGFTSFPSNRAMSLRPTPSRVPERFGSRLNASSSLMAEREATEEQQRVPMSEEEATEERQRVPMSEEEAAELEAAEGTEEEAVEPEGEEGGVDQPVRMSLMALLADGIDESTYMMGEEEEQDEEENGGAVGGELNNCCVCMVRHKGAAFIPCGHTFCRLCSRELWVQRGSCPLCNNFIVEILDIF